MSERVDQLQGHFDEIYRERMRDLPIVNDQLAVEAIGFREFEDHEIGVLLTPWFMNLFLITGDDQWSDTEQGSTVDIPLPAENCEFIVSHDDELGTYLSAILFRTVADFPDQDTARAVADEVMASLFSVPEADPPKRVSRRTLLSGMRAS
jgi:[NiFe] hydrogenase assembly HybE family chaperone